MAVGIAAFLFVPYACSPPKPEPVKTVTIPDGEIDPAVWGKVYPEEFELWKKTEEPDPAGKSKYKRGFDADGITYDKLAEFPYMALLFNGWGVGVEYNEPRGHAHMLRDQVAIDASRLKSGGVCLTCKTPYAPLLEKELGEAYYRTPFKEVLDRIPEKFRDLGVACADCHMPYTRIGLHTVADHRGMSPLKNDMKACMQCHTETAAWLREQVIAIQDRTASLGIRAGYATATTAKLFEAVHKLREEGKTFDQALYDKAKEYYEEAFYRSLFVGAENSMGFHNPTEALRILGDAVAFAAKAEGYLRQILAKAGVDVPARVDLELAKYLNDRGAKKLPDRPEQEFKDPMGVQRMF